MRTSNPALNEKVFSQVTRDPAHAMTVNGAVNKTLIMLVLLLIPAFWAWAKVAGLYASFAGGDELMIQQQAAATIKQLGMWSMVFGFGGLGIALVYIFSSKAKVWGMVLAPAYAICEGFLIGGISAMYEMQFPGIVMNAAGLTIATLVCLLAVYKMGWIKATQGFRTGITIATGAIFLIYVVNWIAGMFGHPMPMIHDSGMLGIGFSLFVVGIAALNLILDFDFFEKGEAARLPKHMEWYAAFGLMVTLIWLYLEMLRLLSKLRSR